MTVRAAVIGCGDISALHVAAIAATADAELVAVCDTDPARADAASARHHVPGFGDHRALFDQARPDVVHVCTPHAAHAAIVIDALERGIHVIVEKPIARDPAQAAEIVAAAERSSAKIAVCFQNRYNTPVQAAHELLRSGRAGRILGGAATVLWHRTPEYYAAAPWRGTWAGGGGGMLMNQAIHTLDLLQWLIGPVTEIAGTAARRALPIEVEDTAEMTLTHVGGAHSVFYATVAHATNEPITVDIAAEHAHLRLRGDLEIAWADGRVDTVADERTATGERAYWGVSHERLIADFYRRLPDPEPFWITPEAGASAVRIIHDVYATSFPAAMAALASKRSIPA
nr:Gfo/Idh/MocA family oxidoreductase [Microbacterium bovistercoris]